MIRIATAMSLAITVAACSQAPEGDTPASDATDVASAPTGDPATPAPATGEPTPAPTSTDPDAATAIPAHLQGRWGMVPADCTSTRGDAKGLLTIGPRTLKFYESVGTLASETERGDSLIRGQFSFTGEGMTWTRDVSLSANGNVLTRTERGGDEPGGPFTYTRCA